MMRRFFPSTIRGGGAVNLYENATIVQSMQKLNPNYTGFCWRVFRVSDSTLHEIGFDGTGWVSESELSTILGTGIGRLDQWPDQMGNNNATAPSAATRPLIWDNGFRLGLNSLPSVDFEGTAVRQLNFASDIEYYTTNGIFQLNVVDTVLNQNQQILSHLANRQWRITNIGNLQTTGGFGFVNVQGVGTKKVVGIRAYPIAGVYHNQIFDEFSNSTLIDQSATSSWTLNRIGVRSASSELFRGVMHENIFFNDYSLCPETAIINEKIATYK